MRCKTQGFTLAELLVSIAVLTIIVLFVSRLVSSASNIVGLGYERMDADSQMRPILNRVAVDFSQMLKRADVDYYVKSSLDPEAGNDRIAFFCSVPGYYPSTGSKSSISLVSYRVNPDSTSQNFNKLERLGKGLLWNGSSTPTPMLFGLQAIVNNWPAATDPSLPDPDYELAGPQIFRFEYFYLLKSGLVSNLPGAQGMQDVASVAVTLATVDPKSRVLLSSSQLSTLARRLKDFDPSKRSSDLTTSWQSTLNGITDMPHAAISAVRIYQRFFPIR